MGLHKLIYLSYTMQNLVKKLNANNTKNKLYFRTEIQIVEHQLGLLS